MPNDYPPNSASRRKAKTLNAQDAEVLITSSLSVVRPYLAQKQINQVQKVLDAAVVNPAVKKEAEDLNRRSITHRAGSLVMRDPRVERQADRALQGMIWVRDEDKHIRLDFEQLLGTDALEPITDNPDEAEYLKKIRNTLKEKGVWLRVGQERLTDPRSFVVWLSLGYDGDAIPTDIGFLDREAILGNQLLGARYFEEVTQGKVKKTLESAIYSLELEIEDGEREHTRLIRRYDDALPGVAELSDAIGGADLPGRSIWVASKRLMSNARELNTNGNILGSQACLLLAAVAISEAAQLLSSYAEKSSAGAASVAKILEVAVTVAAIVETCRGLGAVRMLLKGSLKDAAKEAVKIWTPKTPGQQAFANDLKQMSYVLRDGKTILGSGARAGQSSRAGTGFDKGW